MQNRTRIPTIFSIYMMDVLCCALGCVILLWQVNHQEAEKQTEEALSKTQEVLAQMEKLRQAQLSIASLSSEIGNLKISLDASNKRTVQVSLELDDARKAHEKAEQLALVRKSEFDALRKTHEEALAVLNNLKLNVKTLEEKNTLTASELSEKIRAHTELLKKIAEAEGRIVFLEKDVTAKQAELLLANRSLLDQSSRITDAEKQLLAARTEGVDGLNKLKLSDLRIKLLEQELVKTRTEAFDSQRRIQDLVLSEENLNKRLMISVKDLSDLKSSVTSLQDEKMSLLQRNRTIQQAAESRFAGIALTGKRIVFLVDMSGSMELLDADTGDPDKWPIVCGTVAKIMESLPELEAFQVVLFSDRVRYPLGSDRQWLQYQSKETAKIVAEMLKKVKPKGETNMYDAFEEAFRYRDMGLDAIYVLSDGLPNAGPGIPTNVKLTDQQQMDFLGKSIRTRLKTVWNRPTPQKVRINTIGYFFESPEVGSFLWALARENDGSFVGMSKP